MSKGKKIMPVVAIMLTNIAVMCYAGPAAMIADVLYGLFPESSVNFMLIGPSLLFGIVSLAAPLAIEKIGARVVLIAGVVLTGIGGIFGAAVQNDIYMIVMASIMGVGAGLANVAGVSLIHRIYTDQAENARMIGLYNASMAIIGSAMSYVIGLLCVSHWTDGWKIYWVSVIELILCVIFLPRSEPVQDMDQQETKERSKGGLGSAFVVQMAEFFLFSLFYYGPFMMLVSLVVSENNLGGSSVAGLAYSLASVGSFLFSLFFGLVFSRLKRIAATPACFVAGGCLALFLLFPSAGMLYVIEIIGGCAYSLFYNWCFVYPEAEMDSNMSSKAFGCVLFVNTLGSFFTSYLSTFLMSRLDCGFTRILPMFIGGFFIVGTADILLAVRDMKNNKGKAGAGEQQ